MKHSQTIRLRAREVRSRIFDGTETAAILLDPKEVLRRLDALTSIEREPVAPGHSVLQNSFAVINPAYLSLFYRSDLPAWFQFFCQAHEYAHYFLHGGESHCAETDVKTVSNCEDLPTGETRVHGYSAREKREREANLFARELLLPADLLKKLFVENDWRAADFVKTCELPLDFVCQQLAYALLIGDAETQRHRDAENNTSARKNADSESYVDEPRQIAASLRRSVAASQKNVFASQDFRLDDSQKRAAQTTAKRLLVEAGPGTGKTGTLVARVLHLLDAGVAPTNLLVLTFSNKAAEEMRARIAAARPVAAAEIWLGTFHAFGLEILRKFAAEAELANDFGLLDPIDAALLLEQSLLELKLEHYQNLLQPNQNLKSILQAISRAKDELVDADDYERAAKQMLAEADDAATRAAAEKAAEVARVYRIYERLLAERNAVDLGDLLFRAVRLLQTNRAVKADLQNRFRHVLVDEFQDTNRASGRLLGELAGENNDLWIVGDARQTIYRWRGASAANLQQFKNDFPDADVIVLSTNYRSQQPIVDLLNEFAAHVEGSTDFQNWTARRGKSGEKSIHFVVADDLASEADSVAAQIRQKQAANVPFSEQAVLARTNNILTKFAAELERGEIPVLYLGNLFERPEIRDLLSILALTTPDNERHVLRLCEIGEYAISLQDARALIAFVKENETDFFAALERAPANKLISADGQAKFKRLAEQFADVDDATTAWQFFAAYLFDRSNYLKAILHDETARGQAKQFAIYQLLQFALDEAQKPARFAETNSRAAFLRFVRHLANSGDETVFRRLPAWTENVDAVKLLTVHQAKGLEFPVVFLPHLGNRYYPNSRRGDVCPLPAALAADKQDAKAAHEAEEKCLFFVAVSRARDNLFLSCAARYGDASSKRSRFLDLLETTLPAAKKIDARAASESNGENRIVETAQNRLYSFYELELYLRCPRQYFYEQVLRLREDREAAAYLQFHNSIYETIAWAKNAKRAGSNLAALDAQNKLNEIWRAKPVSLHAYAAIYFAEAQKLVAQAFEFLIELENNRAAPNLEFAVANERVSLKFDSLEHDARTKTVIASRIKTGRAPADSEWSERDKLQFSALQAALWANFPDCETKIELNYLSDNRRLVFETTAKKVQTQTSKLETAIRGINKRDFRAAPDAHRCPACAHYFLCPGENSKSE